MTDITQINSQIEQGDSSAADQLLPLVYDELRKLATAKLVNEKPGQTLQATALVHDAYIRLVDVQQAQHWDSRGHFFAAAAEAMRRILVDSALRRRSLKRGGDHQRVEFDSQLISRGEKIEDILAIDEALNRLASEDHQAAELVKLHFFAGCSIPEAAELLGISRSSAYRQWAYARAALQCLLED